MQCVDPCNQIYMISVWVPLDKTTTITYLQIHNSAHTAAHSDAQIIPTLYN